MKAETPFKQQYGWSVRALLPITPAGAEFFHRRKISANAVSVLSLVVFLGGLFVYVVSGSSSSLRILSALMFIVGTYLDVLDGYVARLAGSAGKFGAYLDAGIDLVRYNLFFLAVWMVTPLERIAATSLAVYALLLNISFFRLFRSIARGQRQLQANEAVGRLAPLQYRDFCHRWKLLYNPLNLEDQLLFFLFVMGVVFRVEAQMITLCTALRIFELSLAVRDRYLPDEK